MLTTYRSGALLKTDMAEYARDLAGAVRFDSAGVPVGLAPSEDGDPWIHESLRAETANRVLDASGRTAQAF